MIQVRAFLLWLFLIVVGLFLAWAANADTNLTAQCKSGASSGSKQCTGGVIYRYPDVTAFTRTTGDVFYFWGVLGAASKVSVCAADIPPGTSLCSLTTFIPKSQVPLGKPAEPGIMRLKASWPLPTTGSQDGKTVPLASGDLLAVRLAWNPKAGGPGGEIVLPGTTTSHEFEIPAVTSCVSVSVQGREAWSDPSPLLCKDPAEKAPVIPDPIFGMTLEIVR